MEISLPLFQPSEVLSWSLNPEKFSSFLSNRHLKTTQTYTSDKFLIYDLKLDVRGYEEDELYLKNLILRTNIKRGNSLMLVGRFSDFKNYSSLGNVNVGNIQEIFWVRRGLTKFFDVSFEALSQLTGFHSQNKKKSGKMMRGKNDHHQVTFECIENQILQGFLIDVYVTEKANGENVQVSYLELLQKWMISSKNCSLVVSDPSEIDDFHNDRYKFTKSIAAQWFSILRTVKNVENLKRYLNGRTLVGEYIGNQQFKHIVSYSIEEIRFFAIVENCSAYSCLPVLESFYYFKLFNLPSVQVNKFGRFFEKIELYNKIKDLFKKISSQTLENSGEGSVLYFVRSKEELSACQEVVENEIFSGNVENLTSGEIEKVVLNQVTLSLAKIKTIEYRIYRKIREKLKLLKKGSGSLQSSIEKFSKDIKSMIDTNSSTKNAEFFINEFIKTAEKVLGPKKVTQEVEEPFVFEESKNSESIIFLETSPLYEVDPNTLSEELGMFYDNKKDCHKFVQGHIYHNILRKNNFPVINSAIYIFAGFSLKSEQKYQNSLKNKSNDRQKHNKSKKNTKKPETEDSFKIIRNLIEKHSSEVDINQLDPPDEKNLMKELKKIMKNQKDQSNWTRSKEKQSSIIFIPCFLPSFNKSFIISTLSSIITTEISSNYELINLNALADPSSQDTQVQNGEILSLIQELRIKSTENIKKTKKTAVFFIDHRFDHDNLKTFIEFLQVIRTDFHIIGIFPDTSGYNLKKKQSFMFSELFLISGLKNIVKNRPFDEELKENIQVFVKIFKEYSIETKTFIERRVDDVVKVKVFDENWITDEKVSDLVRGLVQDNFSNNHYSELVEKVKVLEIPEVHDSPILSERFRKFFIIPP
jgi:hypothetical protein